MLSTLSAGAAVASLLLTGSASPTTTARFGDDPPTGKITITVATVNGSGCRPGSAAVAIAPDNTAFTVTYSEYLAQAGSGSKPTDSRKNCQIALNVHVPQGFTYAIARADYRGYASLAPGAKGLETAGYYFQGQQQTARKSHSFTGPYDSNWQTSDETDIDALVYAPCGEERYFNINTEMRVDAKSADPKTTSYMAMDSTDGSINTLYHFAWKECPGRR
ncbi:DUF4360 domain-containing protein [Streptomyces libani]|uniref:DUF4360 domain-containing protein n=2 Tax=Streptomyces nigrescens TaxID=1920 RepID=A0ABY7IDG1_STRNI|nr:MULTISPECIES: DUF4360 domain-containing protein [Streptomyces]AWN29697.1 DUF4360 domain-containing protein [Streptomyces sp. NEAU-S7GS2]MCX5448167.1 DUF4360 domain-containing protein [Streptomyces libani]MCX5448466.1 DUF4360 domain-containing protein [Streptomyces libani]MYT13536.1 DUF4360 domain-containing protein [Streptomyces sp. SID4951]MYX09604.1 DUF4360 domain-containing protein [Streptomyces sp. SID8375]